MFVKDLYVSGLLRFTVDPLDFVTPFFVTKKDGRLRLVWDCRGSNRRFKKCSKLRVASGAKWSEFQLGAKESLYVAQSDIPNFFYALGIPKKLSRYFCLPPVRVEFLMQLNLPPEVFSEIKHHKWVNPCLRVVPMGGLGPCGLRNGSWNNKSWRLRLWTLTGF